MSNISYLNFKKTMESLLKALVVEHYHFSKSLLIKLLIKNKINLNNNNNYNLDNLKKN